MCSCTAKAAETSKAGSHHWQGFGSRQPCTASTVETAVRGDPIQFRTISLCFRQATHLSEYFGISALDCKGLAPKASLRRVALGQYLFNSCLSFLLISLKCLESGNPKQQSIFWFSQKTTVASVPSLSFSTQVVCFRRNYLLSGLGVYGGALFPMVAGQFWKAGNN